MGEFENENRRPTIHRPGAREGRGGREEVGLLRRRVLVASRGRGRRSAALAVIVCLGRGGGGARIEDRGTNDSRDERDKQR